MVEKTNSARRKKLIICQFPEWRWTAVLKNNSTEEKRNSEISLIVNEEVLPSLKIPVGFNQDSTE
jgi:hypothetical protein